MQKTWSRIETWLREHAPELHQSLQRGASAADIRKAEQKLGVALPEEVKESYRLHDGQAPLASPLMGEWQLLSLKNVLRQWDIQQKLLDDGSFDEARGKPVGPVRPDWYNARWVPIAYNGGGDLYCLDFDPASGGRQGQVVTFWHADDKRERIAESFGALLEAFADDLEQGRYQFENGMLVRKAPAKARKTQTTAQGKRASAKKAVRKVSGKKAPARKSSAKKARTPTRRR